MENPLKYFAELRDPRVERNREHLLDEILLIAIAAVLSGAESWNDIAEYGADKLEWLQTFLTLPSGIPSHDTFKRAGHAAQNFSVFSFQSVKLQRSDRDTVCSHSERDATANVKPILYTPCPLSWSRLHLRSTHGRV